MGFTFSFAWTPCIGPALSSILLLAASSGDFWYSNFLMIIYAFGFTLPFLVLGLFTNKSLNWLNSHCDIVKYTTKIGAVILKNFVINLLTHSSRNCCGIWDSNHPDTNSL